uniref:C3H1-type domain-containing protein n=1 Tax=Glossina austeni TaxID=7395 RepID=A0A1A9UGX1_GLOAU
MRGACKRAESECRFAHPQESVARHDDGSITVCMDAVKGRCTRDPCRYFHPPLHLQAQLKAAQSRATAVAAAAAHTPDATRVLRYGYLEFSVYDNRFKIPST